LPGVRHQIRNESKESIRFLVISQPPSHADRTND
jgi:mannose-6-phosphate isomerase-like protein (cupin superfamily)